MQKLQVSYNKTLKLTNVCIRRLLSDSLADLENIVVQMDNYIRSKGATPIGPLIQCTNFVSTKNGEQEPEISLLRQADKFVSKTEAPYSMSSVLRCTNCLFVRFNGNELQLKFAYDKLNLIAFEEDIPLTGRSYTIFTSQGDDMFSADVFVEKV